MRTHEPTLAWNAAQQQTGYEEYSGVYSDISLALWSGAFILQDKASKALLHEHSL